MKENIRSLLKKTGASAVGFAKAGETEKRLNEGFLKWLKRGDHAGMNYLEQHASLRQSTDHVLSGSKTVISLAFSYVPIEFRNQSFPLIATYAYGKDYHKVIRKRLKPAINQLKESYGGEWRICVDSAPVEERYWAVKSGIGTIGMNGAVITEGCGSYCFLAEILTTVEIDPDKPNEENCEGCGACISACPGSALNEDGSIDCRRCISYLTIEKKGEWSANEKELMSSFQERKTYLFGCDECLKVCPHNQGLKPTVIEEFQGLEEILTMNEEKVKMLTEEKFNAIYATTSLKRSGINGLKRNINLKSDSI